MLQQRTNCLVSAWSLRRAFNASAKPRTPKGMPNRHPDNPALLRWLPAALAAELLLRPRGDGERGRAELGCTIRHSAAVWQNPQCTEAHCSCISRSPTPSRLFNEQTLACIDLPGITRRPALRARMHSTARTRRNGPSRTPGRRAAAIRSRRLLPLLEEQAVVREVVSLPVVVRRQVPPQIPWVVALPLRRGLCEVDHAVLPQRVPAPQGEPQLSSNGRRRRGRGARRACGWQSCQESGAGPARVVDVVPAEVGPQQGCREDAQGVLEGARGGGGLSA